MFKIIIYYFLIVEIKRYKNKLIKKISFIID